MTLSGLSGSAEQGEWAASVYCFGVWDFPLFYVFFWVVSLCLIGSIAYFCVIAFACLCPSVTPCSDFDVLFHVKQNSGTTPNKAVGALLTLTVCASWFVCWRVRPLVLWWACLPMSLC